MEQKRFQKNDSGFVCENCGRQVKPLGYTSRDHCPHCLCSKHVDLLPGDRENPCRGRLLPVQSFPDERRGFVIRYRCEKCGKEVRNVAARDDDTERLIQLTVAQ